MLIALWDIVIGHEEGMNLLLQAYFCNVHLGSVQSTMYACAVHVH